MDFTFGIITAGSDLDHVRIEEVLNSIGRQSIPIDNHEVIIVDGNRDQDIIDGSYNTHYGARGSLTAISFDETIKNLWITKKKNIITQYAKYENIVYMHDYVMLNDYWHQGFLDFGNDWDICMNVQINTNSRRFRDWITLDHPNIDPKTRQIVRCARTWRSDVQKQKVKGGTTLVPYDYDGGYMYIPGTYWVAKKHVMEAEPLNEDLCHAESEDIEWSLRVRDKYKYVMNPLSAVHLLNYKPLDHSWFRLIEFLERGGGTL